MNRVAPVLAFGALLGAWAAISGWVGPHILPGPRDVLPDLVRIIPSGEFVNPLLVTLGRTAVGFAVAFTAGTAFGLVSAKRPLFTHTMSVLFGALLFAPALVIIFLGIVMIGTNTLAVAAITGLTVGPIVAIYMREAMGDIDPELLLLAQSYKVETPQMVRDVYIPYLIPPMLGTSRIAFSMSWKIVMISEVFGFSGGLGFQIRLQYGVYNLSLLMAWLAVFIVTLLAVEQLIRLTERVVVKWEH